jgi:hypothetical protein
MTTDCVGAVAILSDQCYLSVFTVLAFHVVVKFLATATIHCGKKLTDQLFRGVDNVVGARSARYAPRERNHLGRGVLEVRRILWMFALAGR